MPRRFGVICDDLRAAPWVQRLAETASPPALLAVNLNDAARTLCSGVPGLRLCDRWEALAADESLTDVLIGGAAPEALAAARPLAQAGKTVWVLPHPRQGLMFAYEIALQLEEGQGIIAPVFPERSRPHWQQLLAAQSSGQLGQLRFIQLERTLRGANTLDVAAIDQQLLWDLDLLRKLGGRYTRVTALRVGDESATRQQTVTLAGDGVPELMWTIRPGPSDAFDRIALHAGDAVWELHELSDATVRMAAGPDGLQTHSPNDPLDVLFPAGIAADAWREAVEAFELFDGVQYSLERRRTIDLHREPVSERTIFKTRMVALGCLVLFGTLVLLMAYLAAATVLPLGNTALLVLRGLVFAPLVVYLLAQLLLPLARSARPRPDTEKADSDVLA